jgi:2-methylisocitrate lyase-like PEP mutase family enzyme
VSNSVSRFRALHASGCFVIPNPWDIGSAKMLAHLGYSALATSSAGFGFTRGLPDRVDSLACDDVIAHAGELARATPLPVSADFQDGYAEDAEGVAANVARCMAAGAAGLSIEDATGDRDMPLYPREIAIERVRAARAAIGDGVLTARCEAYLVGADDPFAIVMDRLVAFADAGADCLFAPGVREPEKIGQIVRAVAPRAVNVIVSTPGLTVAQLEELGVRRISVGSALARVAWAAMAHAARDIQERGSFDALGSAMSFAAMDEVMR